MERLTVRDENGNAKLAKNDIENISEILLEVIDRLADYEDLEITAEQVRDIDKAYTELCVKYVEYTKLGTIEECREAIEKQNPTKPYCIEEDKVCCPYCHSALEDGDEICSCGQRIDWNK